MYIEKHECDNVADLVPIRTNHGLESDGAEHKVVKLDLALLVAVAQDHRRQRTVAQPETCNDEERLITAYNYFQVC